MVCPLFHPVLFSVCQCRRCNWGLALDKGKKIYIYPTVFGPLLSDSLRNLCHAVARPRVTARWTEIPPRLWWRSGRCGDASKRGARPISHDERSPAKLASPDVAWPRMSIRGYLTPTFMTGHTFATSVWLTLGTDTGGQRRFTLGSVSLLLRRAQSGL